MWEMCVSQRGHDDDDDQADLHGDAEPGRHDEDGHGQLVKDAEGAEHVPEQGRRKKKSGGFFLRLTRCLSARAKT